MMNYITTQPVTNYILNVQLRSQQDPYVQLGWLTNFSFAILLDVYKYLEVGVPLILVGSILGMALIICCIFVSFFFAVVLFSF